MDFFGVAGFAFPDFEHFPAKFDQFLPVFAVPAAVAFEFGAPELLPRFGHARLFAVRVGMPVPEAAVDEDDFPAAGKDEIRLARQVLAVQPEAVAHAVDEAADQQLDLAVLGADAAHQLAALLLRYCVGHVPSR